MDERYLISINNLKMFTSQRNSHSNSVEKRAPYCDTCYRKGLSPKEYTSHFTRSEPGPRGVVVCPTILSAVCKTCGEKGHWANDKFCPVMRRESKMYNQTKREELKKTKTKTDTHIAAPKKNDNLFAVLMDDEEPVVIAPHVKAKAVNVKPSWADMAKKAAPLPPPLPFPVPFDKAFKPLSFQTIYYDSKDFTPLMTDAEREALKILQERKAAGYFETKRSSWLDSSDDEDEDEDEYNMAEAVVDDEEW